MDDFIKIAHELGMPGVWTIAAIFGLWKIGGAVYDACAWFGPNFLVPIRDSLIGNIAILTAFIAEMRAVLPILRAGQERSVEASNTVVQKAEDFAKDAAKTRQMQVALARVLASKCNIDGCPLVKSVMDSDDFAQKPKKSDE